MPAANKIRVWGTDEWIDGWENIPIGAECSDDFSMHRFGRLIGWTLEDHAMLHRLEEREGREPTLLVFVVPRHRLRVEFLLTAES